MKLERAILQTLVYHDIFDYPLKAEEIHRYQIGERASRGQIDNSLKLLEKNKKIKSQSGLFFLKGRKKIIKLRQSRGRFTRAKLKRAKLYARLLMAIPTIKLVAISGALAMENAQKKDDIDLVIIASKNTLWTTRLLANILLQPFRRKAGEPHTKDKACLNLFLEEYNLKIGTQNLYTAHEVAQMRPLWQRQNTYHRFLKANTWVKNYLPNWQASSADSTFAFPQLGIIQLFEKLAKNLQLFYMKKKITTEKIGKHQLFFHPKDTQNLVLKMYVRKLQKLLN